MRIIIAAVLLALSFTSIAADRSSKIKALMEAQGLLQMWDQQMATQRQQSRQQAQQILNQAISSLSPPPTFEARFRDAFDEYMNSLQTPWTPQDLVDVWAQKYGARFTDDELDGLLAYYTSPLGRKDVAAAQAAMPEFVDYFMEAEKPITRKATQIYLDRLKKAVEECKCQRK